MVSWTRRVIIFCCLAWPRPLLVGPILMATAALLEGLQALTPDRVPHLEAALYGAGGTLVAALLAALVIHLWKRRAGSPQKSK